MGFEFDQQRSADGRDLYEEWWVTVVFKVLWFCDDERWWKGAGRVL